MIIDVKLLLISIIENMNSINSNSGYMEYKNIHILIQCDKFTKAEATSDVN
jgi:hypothetical protein